MEQHDYFKPRARLIVQLGDQLIRSEGIAMLELLKNSYDADATKVTVQIEKIDEQKLGKIILEDNGNGMNSNIVRNVWLEPGTLYKVENKYSPTFRRRVLGEKGIGRFAVHKLGREIELITRIESGKEVFLKIDWKQFENASYLNQIPLSVIEREPEVFTGDKKGTKIIITDLRQKWNKRKFREAYRTWVSLTSPFKSKESFSIDFDIDNKKWVEGLITPEEVAKHAIFSFSVEAEGKKITKFSYKFHPWDSMKRLRGRELTEKDDHIKTHLTMEKFVYDEIEEDDSRKKKKKQIIDLSKYKIGKIKIQGLIFDRDPRVLELGIDDKDGFNQYLDQNGGVRVYRDDVRVFDYGEKGNDWLSLDVKRINAPTERISNNIILASVNLDRNLSEDLEEKANREGFLENEAYFEFVEAVSYVMELIEICRKPDKNKLRTVYGPTKKTEPVVARIDELSKLVNKKIKNNPLKLQILKTLRRLKDEYDNVNTTLLKSAGAGLTFSAVIHQAEKIVKEIETVLNEEPNSDKIVPLVKNLAGIIEGHLFLLKKSGIKPNSLKKIIDIALTNISVRLRVHNISLVKEYEEFKENETAYCADGLTVGTIMNLVDNSIFWLDKSGEKNKKIFIGLSSELEGYVSAIVADNGTGFTIPIDQTLMPFVSGKPYGTGLGLHIASETMKAQKGLIIFPNWGDFTIPSDFKKGAVIVLAFKESK